MENQDINPGHFFAHSLVTFTEVKIHRFYQEKKKTQIYQDLLLMGDINFSTIEQKKFC